MKYRSFRNFIVIPGVLILLCGSLFACVKIAQFMGNDESGKSSTVASSPVPAGPAPVYAPTKTYNKAPDESGKAVQMCEDYLKANTVATTDKIKDLFKKERFKVNLYRDGNSPTWSRLKIDLDRDEKDDEKWTLENGRPSKRQISTNDDDVYDKEYRWRAGQWVEKK